MSTIVNADCGQVLGIVDGRDSAAVGGWLNARSPAWRARIEVVAIDPSAAFRKAITERCRTRKSVSTRSTGAAGEPDGDPGPAAAGPGPEQRRGRKVDPAWANRMLLLRGYDTLSARAKARLQTVFATDDPTQELSAAWGVKEQLRRLLNTDTVEQARTEKMILGCYVLAADMEETWRLWAHHPDLVASDRGAHRDPRHQRPHRSREHRHQADQTHRPGIQKSQPTTKPVSCSAAPPDARREPIDQAGHHGQMRIANNVAPAAISMSSG